MVGNHLPLKQLFGHFVKKDDDQRGAFLKQQAIDDQKLHISYLHQLA